MIFAPDERTASMMATMFDLRVASATPVSLGVTAAITTTSGL